jgi:hypothetical protein
LFSLKFWSQEVATEAAVIEVVREPGTAVVVTSTLGLEAEVETVSITFVIEDAGTAVEEGVRQDGGTTDAVDGDKTEAGATTLEFKLDVVLTLAWCSAAHKRSHSFLTAPVYLGADCFRGGGRW